MRTLIFSDIHLTNAFNHKLFNLLDKLINNVDQVVINGDLWDGQLIDVDQFIRSRWNKLFPLLLKKKAVFIYGNHDPKSLCCNQEQLFSTEQTQQYRLPAGDKTLVIEHGDKYCFFPESDSKLKLRFLYLLEELATRVTGNRIHRLLFQKLNNKIKKQLAGKLSDNEIYVCGHTHVAEDDRQNQFMNSGFIQYGLAQYILVNNDEIRLVTERY